MILTCAFSPVHLDHSHVSHALVLAHVPVPLRCLNDDIHVRLLAPSPWSFEMLLPIAICLICSPLPYQMVDREWQRACPYDQKIMISHRFTRMRPPRPALVWYSLHRRHIISLSIRPHAQYVLLTPRAENHTNNPILLFELIADKCKDRVFPKASSRGEKGRHQHSLSCLELHNTPFWPHRSATPLRKRRTHFPPFGSSSQTGLLIRDAKS
jgi:hypothetical protein